MAEASGFLPTLTRSMVAVSTQGDNMSTKDFVTCCEHIIPVFGMLGTVFSMAKRDFNSKKDSLAGISDQLVTLQAIVAEDKANGTVTTKDSCSRNLHR